MEKVKQQIENIMSGLDYKDRAIILKEITDEFFCSECSLNNGNKVHFPRTLYPGEAERLFVFLMEGGYIGSDTKEKSFMYHLGYLFCSHIKAEPIKWIENKQLLRELLESLYSLVMSKADIERMAAKCFIDKKGKPMLLAKNKNVPNVKSDNLKDHLANTSINTSKL